MATYDAIRDLPLTIDSYDLEPHEQPVSVEFTRYTTVIRLRGGGHEGMGEDVTYDGIDHVALTDAGPSLPFGGQWTMGTFSEHLESIDLWPAPPVREPSRDYRRWAYESAALDLALRQAGTSLPAVLGREARPVHYVVSMRLGEPATIDPLLRRLELYPGLKFKLDPTNSWTPDLVQQLVDTGAVNSLDLKGLYRGTPVDVDADPELYSMVATAFPDAWLEDPDLSTPELRESLAGQEHRITWDAPIHSIDDIEGLQFAPRMINIKPSRFGPLERLFATYDYCEERGIGAYGGGQSELSVGRGHIQYLAALFHPDTPNDTAPGQFNSPEVPAGLPASPLEPRIDAVGFRWLTG
jgi:L-alanine-DL-glutamate epimerase-like enolase superfamily enzyme